MEELMQNFRLFTVASVFVATSAFGAGFLDNKSDVGIWVTDATPGWFCLKLAAKLDKVDANAVALKGNEAIALEINGDRYPVKLDNFSPNLQVSNQDIVIESKHPDLRTGKL